MRKYLVLALAVAALAWSTPARASDPILFDPDAGGGLSLLQINGLDWAPGNSLLVESTFNPVTGTGAGTVYFQANLGIAYVGTNTPVFTNGTGGNYFTAVAGFGVTFVQGEIPGVIRISSFSFDPSNPVNFFNVYHNSTGADDLSGSCFVCGGPAVLTAKAFAVDNTGNLGNFAVDETKASVALDQFGTNNYPGTSTLTGQGSTNVTVQVQSFNAAYFPSLSVGSSLVITNTSLISPYNQTNPSACFDGNGLFDANNGDTTCGNGASELLGVGSVGAVNGAGDHIVVLSDANSAFVAPTIVPEPTTLSLLGLGLLVGGAHLRRRSKKNA